MRCPVHNVEGCVCQYARKPRVSTGTETLGPIKTAEVYLAGVRSPGHAKVLALSFAAAVIACGPRPATCSERDAELIAHEAACLAQVKDKCAGVPLDEPCPFEEDCKAFTRERCK